MLKGFKTKVKLSVDKLFSEDLKQQIVEDAIAKRVKNIRSGKAIRGKYSYSTKKDRKRHGLQVSYIDLTGNKKYSRKTYRMLDDYSVVKSGKNKYVIKFLHKDSEELHGYHSKRYGKILDISLLKSPWMLRAKTFGKILTGR